MDKVSIIEELKNKSNHYVEVKFGGENSSAFRIICDFININGFTFTDVSEIRFVGSTMWIGEASHIDIEDVEEFKIHKEIWLVK